MKSIGIITGKFKPPHVGHYLTIRKIADSNDSVHVFVSPIEIGGITGEAAISVLKEYLKKVDNVHFHLSKNSPVKEAYEFVDLLGKQPDAEDYVLNVYALPSDMGRFSSLERFAGNIGKIERHESLRPTGTSGTAMRQFLQNKDRDNFMKHVPKEADSDKVWKTLTEGSYAIPASSFNLDQPDFLNDPTPINVDLGGIPTQWTNSQPYSRWDLTTNPIAQAHGRNPVKKKPVMTFAEYVEDVDSKKETADPLPKSNKEDYDQINSKKHQNKW